MIYSIDGNQVCCVGAHFKCLATDHAGFGDSLEEAFYDYFSDESINLPRYEDLHDWEIPWLHYIKVGRLGR